MTATELEGLIAGLTPAIRAFVERSIAASVADTSARIAELESRVSLLAAELERQTSKGWAE